MAGALFIMYPSKIDLTVPDWLNDELSRLPTHFDTLEARMAAVIRFSRINVERDTGGPFAAGIFERDTGRMVVIGVNRVVPNNCSSAHAEVMALSQAQSMLDTYDLGSKGLPAHQIVVNWRPCAMCYGAVLWSGVRSLVIAGSGPVVEELTGFDEGPMCEDWDQQLVRRGIEVIDNVMTREACEVFKLFRASGRPVYNARQGK